MKKRIELNGITWDHSRAFPPLCAAAQRYWEINGQVRVNWQKRTLDEFGHAPIETLSERFDLVVIDHPWAGYCFKRDLVYDLKSLLTAAQWTDLQQNCIGPSFESYHYNGQLLAIPIDAATPAPSWRPDLLEKKRVRIPEKWSEAVALADRGLAVMPAFPADLFLNFSMLLEALSAEPFQNPRRFAHREKSLQAMALLRRLAENMPPEIYQWNPIAVAEMMTDSEDFVYCPFAYSYNNYARRNFTARPLRYGNLISLDDGTPLKSIVGGTGIAISKRCRNVDAALDYALFCAGASMQKGIYTHAGGQPVRVEAWTDPALDDFTGNFFSASRKTHEECLLRPRYDGYVRLQERGGIPLQQFLKGEISAESAFAAINAEYKSVGREA